jgi:hypothetical protein
MRGFFGIQEGKEHRVDAQAAWIELRIKATDDFEAKNRHRCDVDGVWSMVFHDNEDPTVERMLENSNDPTLDLSNWYSTAWWEQVNEDPGHPLRRFKIKDKGSGVREARWYVADGDKLNAGFNSNAWVERISETVCRDANGALVGDPDFSVEAAFSETRHTPCQDSETGQFEDEDPSQSPFFGQGSLSGGVHTARVRVTDFVRRQADLRKLYYVDAAAPTCRGVAMANGRILFDARDPGHANGNGSGLAYARVLVNGAQRNWTTGQAELPLGPGDVVGVEAALR